MAAELSKQVDNEADQADPASVTRDFLGGSLALSSKELDLETGQVSIQTQPPPLNLDFKPKPKAALNLFEDTSLSLSPKLPSNPLGIYDIDTYQSVCTLDRVKSALDRVLKVPTSPPSSSSKRRSSSRETGDMVAGACRRCLLYVMMPESDPRCPKCNSVVQTPAFKTKKAKMDLDLSI